MAQKILLVEDDSCFGMVLKSYLELSDYEVTLCTNGKEGLSAFHKDKFDLCLIDVMMPEMDGFTLGRKIRELSPTIPFVYITARGLKEDVKLGYDIGADDYIIKPFDSELLLCKIRAIINRCEGGGYEEGRGRPKLILIGGYEFNRELRTITKGEKMVRLTPKEGKLLELLYIHKDGMLSREKALTDIWGSCDYFTARSMDVYVTKLRKYFQDDDNITIDNIHGSGFRLLIEEEPEATDK